MEKELFPSCAGDQPLADRMPHREMHPHGSIPVPGDRPLGDVPLSDCGCESGGNGGCGENGHHHSHDHQGCGKNCGEPAEKGCGIGICVGYEGCGEGSWGLSAHPLAMVYAPCQTFRALYDPHTALNRGTLFTELDLPLGNEGCGFTTVGDSCRMERRRI